MSKYLDHTERIASYLDGDMTPDRMQEFEQQLHTDPVLRSEFELQQDIIHSLQDFRKTQLKTRLDQVPVSMGPSGLMGIKAAAAIVVSGIIGLSTYLYFNTPEEETGALTESTIMVDEVETPQEAIEETIEIPEEAVETKEVVEEQKAAIEKKETTPEVAVSQPSTEPLALVTLANNEEVTEEADLVKEEAGPVINSPKLINPDLDESNLEESFEIPSAAIAQEGLTDNNVVEIETAKKDNNMFHYQYYSGKLYLYGDFRDYPYEILELNSVNGKRLFIFYNNTYYRIQDDQEEITPLEELTDQDIIKKLEIIQANK